MRREDLEGEEVGRGTREHEGRWGQVTPSLLPDSRPTARRLAWMVVGLAVGLGLLAAAARGIEPDRVLAGLSQADPVWVGLAFLTVLLTTLAKVGRWRGLFPGAKRPAFLLLCKALLVGQLANGLLPARVGDVARAYLVGVGGGASGATALGTVAAEKIFDVFFLLTCAGLASALAAFPPWLNASLAGLAVGGLLFLGLAVLLPRRRVLGWIGRWAHRLPWGLGGRFEQALRRGLTGLAALRRPRQAALASAWSAAIWVLAAGTNYLLFLAFDLPLPPGAALWLLALLHVGVAPPSSPGRLGVFHALTVVGLSVFGVDRSSGLAYATVLHVLVYLPQILPGAVALGFSRVNARAKA